MSRTRRRCWTRAWCRLSPGRRSWCRRRCRRCCREIALHDRTPRRSGDTCDRDEPAHSRNKGLALMLEELVHITKRRLFVSMNDICFELSSSWRSDKAAKNPPSTVRPLFLRKLRGEVRENVGQIEGGYRASRIRWENPSVIIPFGLNRFSCSLRNCEDQALVRAHCCRPRDQLACRRAPARVTDRLSSWSLITCRYDSLILSERCEASDSDAMPVSDEAVV